MAEIILWSLLSFFSAFGLVEFIRFLYADRQNRKDNTHIVVFDDGTEENIEMYLRNAIISVDCQDIILITEDSAYVAEKLQEKYPRIKIMTTEEYINYISNR